MNLQLDHHHDRVLVRSVRRKLSEEPTLIFQLEHRIGRPELNSNENLSAIPKRHVEELGPEAKEKLIDAIVTA
jgi:hypothetical protein